MILSVSCFCLLCWTRGLWAFWLTMLTVNWHGIVECLLRSTAAHLLGLVSSTCTHLLYTDLAVCGRVQSADYPLSSLVCLTGHRLLPCTTTRMLIRWFTCSMLLPCVMHWCWCLLDLSPGSFGPTIKSGWCYTSSRQWLAEKAWDEWAAGHLFVWAAVQSADWLMDCSALHL